MPNILDQIDQIKKLDQKQSYKSIELLYAQVRQVLGEARLIKIPKEYGQVNKVVVNGMGGSNLGAEIVRSVFSDTLKVPILINAGYEVPAFIDKNTLVIISTYSGTTEESLIGYKEIKKRGAKIMAFTAGRGSILEKMMNKDNIPGYLYKDENNPCRVPRYGVGYAIFGMMVLLAKAGLLTIKTKDIENVIAKLELWDHELRPDMKTKMNAAKKMALQLQDKQIVLTASEFLLGSIHTLRNQFCETSKNFASYLPVPDMNHYAMEGLAFPKANKSDLIFFFFDSKLYHPRIQTRMKLTDTVVKKNKIKTAVYKMRGATKLEQAFELLQFGSWVTFYLAMLNGVNPSPNPWVDWFKKELK